MRRSAAVVILSVGAAGLAVACAQVLGVEPGTLSTHPDGSGDPIDGTAAEASGAEASGPDADASAPGSDAYLGDTSVAPPDGDADAAPIPACDPSASDAATGGFGAWYPVGSAIFPPGANVTGVTPIDGEVALFAVDTTGSVVTTHASAPFGAGAWSLWTPVTSTPTKLAPGAPIAAAARGNGRVDLFAVDKTGAVVTLVNGSASGWATVGAPAPTFAAQSVSAVVRGLSDLHVFAIASGAVFETTANGDAGAFSPWTPIGGIEGGPSPSFPSTSTVTAISRIPTVLDVFALGSDQFFYTSSRTFDPVDTGWQPWVQIGSLTFPGGTAIAPAVRTPEQYDLYTLGVAEQPYVNIHSYSVPPPSWADDAGWGGWYSIPGVTAAGGSRIVALGAELNIYLFVIDGTGAAVAMEYDHVSGWSPFWMPLSACGPRVPATSLSVIQGTGTAMEAASVDPSGRVHVADRASSP